MSHKIGVVGGDGIGPEVIAEALKVVAATGVELDTVDYDLGGERYLRDGVVLTDEIVDEWRGLDALLVGVGADLRYLAGYAALPLERLTLLVIPTFYDSIELARERMHAKFERRAAERGAFVSFLMTFGEAFLTIIFVRLAYRLVRRLLGRSDTGGGAGRVVHSDA